MNRILAFLRLIRAVNLLILALGISLFYFFILIPVHHSKLLTSLLPFTNVELVLFILSVLLIAAAGSIIYDYYAFAEHKEFKPQRPLPQRVFSLDTALYLHAAFAFSGIGLGFYLGYKAGGFKIGYIYVVCALLIYVYSAYLKKIPLAGNIVLAALTGFVLLLLMLFEVTFLNTISFDGAGYALTILMWQVKVYGGFAFLMVLTRELVRDLENYEADDAYNMQTFAVQYGITLGKVVTALVLVALLSGVIFMMQSFIAVNAVKEISYLAIAVAVPLFIALVLLFRAKEQKQFAQVSTLLKLTGVLGLLSIPAFYLFNH